MVGNVAALRNVANSEDAESRKNDNDTVTVK